MAITNKNAVAINFYYRDGSATQTESVGIGDSFIAYAIPEPSATVYYTPTSGIVSS
ncbi:MAG: hypothetical protein LBO09_00140 [Candidatus Peribacteria bacterium]|nr:hypothetical protein [Candidatus Peribacteria bacterium]